MCGIYGTAAVDPGRLTDGTSFRQRTQLLYHRGPDDEGYYADAHVRLGMRRLSIIDLLTGQQPITNEDHTLWLVFNGEIYNYRDLRRRLEQEGHVFTSSSDSEVIVHAYEQYGPHCVHHFNGMFAFAVWHTDGRCLFLARDRLGIKPLYYWAGDRQIVFGSELKVLAAHPGVPTNVDLVALDQFLTLEYIPGPRTIYQDVHKLLPGHWLTFRDGRLQVNQYWDVPVKSIPGDEAVCAEALTELIDDAVRLRLVSDVPLGAFLSGGIDSSTVVASMSRSLSEPVRTFSIGFEDETYDERDDAQGVARFFATVHSEQALEPDISELTEQLVPQLDEPFGDFSIFPTYLVSKLARSSVKVVLSGDGGDELFGGYDTYIAQRLARFYDRLPAWLRQKALPVIMAQVPPQPAKKGVINKARRFVEGGMLPASLQHTRWMMFISEADRARLYSPALRTELKEDPAASFLKGYFDQAGWSDPLAGQQYVDVKTYLVDDILTKVDRMSMAASVETRVPLLDHRIVEFALNLPPHMKIRGGRTKVILRRAMANRLPDPVLRKSKQGFSIPVKHWLRGPLRPLMTDLLSPDCVRRRGYFDPETVSQWMSEHLQGRANHSHRLWALMVLELWHQKVLDRGVHSSEC